MQTREPRPAPRPRPPPAGASRPASTTSPASLPPPSLPPRPRRLAAPRPRPPRLPRPRLGQAPRASPTARSARAAAATAPSACWRWRAVRTGSRKAGPATAPAATPARSRTSTPSTRPARGAHVSALWTLPAPAPCWVGKEKLFSEDINVIKEPVLGTAPGSPVVLSPALAPGSAPCGGGWERRGYYTRTVKPTMACAYPAVTQLSLKGCSSPRDEEPATQLKGWAQRQSSGRLPGAGQELGRGL